MPIRDDERESPGHSAARRHEPVLVEPEAGSEASLVPGAPERGTDFRRFALTWAVPLGLPQGRAACAEVSFACRPDGPYFELRLSSPAPPMRQIGPIEVRNLNDDLAAQVFAPPAGAQTAVRVAEKEAVELIAYAIANSLAFRIPITFADGEAAVAEFKSYHFSTAVRPVLFACNMRSLQTEPPSEGDEE